MTCPDCVNAQGINKHLRQRLEGVGNYVTRLQDANAKATARAKEAEASLAKANAANSRLMQKMHDKGYMESQRKEND